MAGVGTWSEQNRHLKKKGLCLQLLATLALKIANLQVLACLWNFAVLALQIVYFH